MRLEIAADEAVAVARAVGAVPPLVQDARVAPGPLGDAVELVVDPSDVPGASGLVRLASAIAGTVTVTARFAGWSGGDASFALSARARGITVERLLNRLVGTLRDAVAAHGLPAEVVELRAGADGPVLVAHVQAAVDARASGVVVRDVALRGGRVTAEVALGDVRLR